MAENPPSQHHVQTTEYWELVGLVVLNSGISRSAMGLLHIGNVGPM